VRVLLDTNVLFAAFVTHGVCAGLYEECLLQTEIVASNHILAELTEKLVGKAGFTKSEALQVVRAIRRDAELVSPVQLARPICRDPDDDWVLASAAAGKVDDMEENCHESPTKKPRQSSSILSPTSYLGTFRIGSPRRPGEGLRVGTVRFLPRGVKKEDYARLDYFDVWFPLLSPSSELLKWLKSREWSSEQVRWSKFRERYVAEMKKTDARQAIKLLAELARATPLSIGCYCENESACHRSILRDLIEGVARI
jgi:uncharacterized protein YeaO (DUF488 family)/predicted nucleic acid-binding protein